MELRKRESKGKREDYWTRKRERGRGPRQRRGRAPGVLARSDSGGGSPLPDQGVFSAAQRKEGRKRAPGEGCEIRQQEKERARRNCRVFPIAFALSLSSRFRDKGLFRAFAVPFGLLSALALAGCRQAVPGATRVGHVDLEVLARLHPAWPERDSLTALIASAHESHQRPIPPFRVPPEPSLPPVSLEAGAADPAERARMEHLIQTRIQRDYEAVRDKVDRDVAHFRETEQSAAEKQASLDADARRPAFLQQYQAEAAQSADRIAPLQLQAIGLQPQPTDPLLLSVTERLRQQQRLGVVLKQIDDLRKERDAHLQALQASYLAALQADRQQRLADAEARVAQYRDERLAELRQTRQRQQEQISADLERSLRLRVALPEVQPPQPGPNAAAARQLAAATSASALATMDRYHEAARGIEHQLFVQRDDLERLILAATRAAVIQLARTHRIDVRFAPAAGPDLTPEFAAWLRERWPAAGGRA
jgi:hypothetical protein